jgi:CheY-like chemotaxis protein
VTTLHSTVAPSIVSGRGTSRAADDRAKRARVLIAEDDDSLRMLMRLSLDIGGVVIDEAADGEAALALARRNPPDVVLLDWMMPVIDGLSVCRALRADPHTAAALIVMVTARALPEDREAALAAGADHYIAKPFSPAALLETVRHAI